LRTRTALAASKGQPSSNGQRCSNGRRSSITRARIVEVAAEIFRRKGFRGAGLDDVARRLGVTKPALYHHIRSKDDLLSAIYLRTLELAIDRIERVAAPTRPLAETFAALLQAHVLTVTESLALVTVFFNERPHLSDRHRREIETKRRRYVGYFERAYRDGVAAGVFRRLDPKLAAFVILGMGSAIYQWFQPAGRCTAEEVSQLIAELACGGYLERHEEHATFSSGKGVR